MRQEYGGDSRRTGGPLRGHSGTPAQASERCRLDPLSVLFGRSAQFLTAGGEVDPELALSYAIWPTEALLEAVAES
jgi:hypothetical protein